MKTNIFKITVVVILLIVTAHSCKQENPAPTLPPETQEGKHTFGCYVNGELFVPSWKAASFGYPSLQANYRISSNSLTIGASGLNGFFTLTVYPEENNKQIQAWITYNNRSRTYKDTGTIVLTRFDLDNLIVSGTFSCEIQYFYSITQGRFDIKMYDHSIRE